MNMRKLIKIFTSILKNVNLWQYYFVSSLIKVHIINRFIFLAKKKKDEGLSCFSKKRKISQT